MFAALAIGWNSFLTESTGEATEEFQGPPTPADIRQWRKAAQDGNVDAMANLGRLCYAQGQLTGSDSAERSGRLGRNYSIKTAC